MELKLIFTYSEKVALFTKEATFSQPGEQSQEEQPIEDKTPVEPTSSTTAMISVDDNTDEDLVQGEVVSSQIITSRYVIFFNFHISRTSFVWSFFKRKSWRIYRSRTVETTTYSCEQDGETETKVEQKVTIQSDGEPIDHDEALAQAIQEATAMNPDMTVEKIEIHQTTQNSE